MLACILDICAAGATEHVQMHHSCALVQPIAFRIDLSRRIRMLTVRTGCAVVHSCRHGVG